MQELILTPTCTSRHAVDVDVDDVECWLVLLVIVLSASVVVFCRFDAGPSVTLSIVLALRSAVSVLD
jgi:hypothetical protein